MAIGMKGILKGIVNDPNVSEEIREGARIQLEKSRTPSDRVCTYIVTDAALKSTLESAFFDAAKGADILGKKCRFAIKADVFDGNVTLDLDDDEDED